MGEKIEATKWGMLALVFIVILTLIGFGMRFLNKRVERAVLVTSHQYQEGMADRAAVLTASLAQIDIKLMDSTLDATTRKNLESQKASITIQLAATRR